MITRQTGVCDRNEDVCFRFILFLKRDTRKMLGILCTKTSPNQLATGIIFMVRKLLYINLVAQRGSKSPIVCTITQQCVDAAAHQYTTMTFAQQWLCWYGDTAVKYPSFTVSTPNNDGHIGQGGGHQVGGHQGGGGGGLLHCCVVL